MRTVQRAELLTHGLFNDLIDEVALSDCTVEGLAAAADPSIFGIRTVRRVEGRVVVHGKPVRVASDIFDRSGTMYINGQIMTADELKKNLPSNRALLLDIESHGWDRVIKTRSGGFKPFKLGDRNIALISRQRNK